MRERTFSGKLIVDDDGNGYLLLDGIAHHVGQGSNAYLRLEEQMKRLAQELSSLCRKTPSPPQ